MKTFVVNLAAMGWAMIVLSANVLAVPGADPVPPVSKPPTPDSLSGKIVAVDRTKKSITLDLQSRIFVFRYNPRLALTLNDQPATVDRLTPGQQTRFVAKRAPDGKFEIVSMDVVPAAKTEVAGSSPGKDQERISIGDPSKPFAPPAPQK